MAGIARHFFWDFEAMKLIIRAFLASFVFFSALMSQGPIAPLSVTGAAAFDPRDFNLRRSLTRPLLQVNNPAGPIAFMNVSGNNRFMTLIMGDGSIRVWDLDLGAQRDDFAASGGTPVAALPAVDGLSVVLVDRGGALTVHDGFTGALQSRLGAHGAAVTAIAGSADGRFIVSGDRNGAVKVWDARGLTLLGDLPAHGDAVRSVAFAADGARVLTAGEDGQARLSRVDDLSAPGATFSGASDGLVKAAFTQEDSVVTALTEDGELYSWAVANPATPLWSEDVAGDPTGMSISNVSQIAAISEDDGDIVIFDLRRRTEIRELEGHDGEVTAVVHDADGRRLISAGEDGTLRIWNQQTGVELVKALSVRGGWAVIDKDGRFDAAGTGGENVSWQTDDQTLTIDRFTEQYFEPGLLASYMAEDDPQLVTENVPVSLPEGAPSLPVVSVNLVEPDTRSLNPVTVVVVAVDGGTGLADAVLFHNGRALPDSAVVERQELQQDGRDTLAKVYSVTPVSGLNEFEAVSYGAQGLEGDRASTTQNFGGAQPAPSLHVVGIGVNDYALQHLRLGYAVNDATAIVKTVGDTSARSSAFASVERTLLLDGNASRQRILNTLSGLAQTQPQDVVMLYMAGHGIVIDNEWYFLPADLRSDSDAAVKRDGVSATQMRDLLVQVAARRVMVMIDSCQSGGTISRFNTIVERRRLNTLGRTTGIALLASARKDQLATELRQLGHGVFTYAIMQGLSGEADTLPRDGAITAGELIRFGEGRVPAYSQRYIREAQVPTAMLRGNDFMIMPQLARR